MPRASLEKLPVSIRGREKFQVAWWNIDSGRPGPCLLVTAAMHGNEVQGSEAVRLFRLLAEEHLVAGRLVLVPFTGRLALRNRRPHIVSTYEHPKGVPVRDDRLGVTRPDPLDNIVLAFPGDPEGNEAQQMAHALMEGIFRAATHNIDLHCYQYFTAAAAYINEDPAVLEFARAGAPPFISVGQRPGRNTPRPADDRPTTLDTWFNGNGRLAFAVELSGQYMVTGRQARLGLRILRNCASWLGMLDCGSEGDGEPVTIFRGREGMVEVTAPVAGLFVHEGTEPGDFVRRGDRLGLLFDDGELETREITAPAYGRLYAFGRHGAKCDVDLADTHPYADAGDTLALICPLPREK